MDWSWSLHPITGVFVRERQREIGDTEIYKEKVKCGGRDWGRVAQNQETTGVSDSHQKLEKRHGMHYSSELQKELTLHSP